MKGGRALLVLVVAMACAQRAGRASEPTTMPLVGTWLLQEVVAVREDGTTVTSRWGPHPGGYIVYDATGHMAAQISGDPRPRFGDPDKPTAEEARAAYESYLAYAGTYVFDAVRSVVTHHIEFSLEPADVGENVQREVRLEGSRVVLLADPYELRGEKVRNRLTWARISGP